MNTNVWNRTGSVCRISAIALVAIAFLTVGCSRETAERPAVYSGPPTEEVAVEVGEEPDAAIEAPPGT